MDSIEQMKKDKQELEKNILELLRKFQSNWGQVITGEIGFISTETASGRIYGQTIETRIYIK
jgi:hypothetical protein